MAPYLSVIIATYNVEEQLPACLTSIAAQTMTDVEVLISDGGSTDATVEVATRFKPLVSHVRSGRDHGIYDAWNQVIDRVRGAWILFLGADDALLDATVLASARSCLETDGAEEGLVGFPCWITGRRERMLFKSVAGVRRSLAVGEMGVAHTSLFHHRSIFTRYGGFDPTFKIAGDLEFLLRARACPLRTYPSPVLTKMAGDGVSNARRFIRLRHSEAMRARRMHGIPSASLKQRFGMALDYVRAWEDERTLRHR